MTINNKPIYKTKNDLSVIGSELTSGTNIVTVIGDAYFFINRNLQKGDKKSFIYPFSLTSHHDISPF